MESAQEEREAAQEERRQGERREEDRRKGDRRLGDRRKRPPKSAKERQVQQVRETVEAWHALREQAQEQRRRTFRLFKRT